MTNSKACTKCGQIKPFEAFSMHGAKRRATCKNCDVESNKIYRANNRDKVNTAKREWANKNKAKKAIADRQYREANSEKIAKKNKAWRERNADYVKQQAKKRRNKNKDQKALADKIWASNNKDKVNANSRRWRASNPEKAKQVGRKSRLANPLIQRNKTARRRSLLRSNGTYLVSKIEILRLLRKGCFYCGANAEHIDHIVPISRGGRHSVGNLTGACKSCNLSKGAKFITEWKKLKNESR